MSAKKALFALCCVPLFVTLSASCGGGDGADIAEVTTTEAPDSTTSTIAANSTTTSAAATTPPPPSGGADSAEAAFRQFVDIRFKGQSSRAWDALLPAQRALLNRDKYFACIEDGSLPGELAGIEVIDQYAERAAVAGIGEQDSMAITATVTIRVGDQTFPDTDTFHAYSEGDRWYVALDDDTFECAKA